MISYYNKLRTKKRCYDNLIQYIYLFLYFILLLSYGTVHRLMIVIFAHVAQAYKARVGEENFQYQYCM